MSKSKIGIKHIKSGSIRSINMYILLIFGQDQVGNISHMGNTNVSRMGNGQNQKLFPGWATWFRLVTQSGTLMISAYFSTILGQI